jgi:hypothetical protein
MVLIYNERGIIMFVAGLLFFGLALLAGYAVGLGDYSLHVTGAFWVIWDFVRRWQAGRRLFLHTAGGHLYFIPFWIIGLAVIWGGVAFQRSAAEHEQRRRLAEDQREQSFQEMRQRTSTRPATEPSDEPGVPSATAPAEAK